MVVDDGSETPAALSAATVGDVGVTIVRQRRLGPAAARNAGLRHARGEFIAFIDDDCVADADWLARLVDTLMRHPGAGVGGTIVNLLDANPWSEASQLLVGFLYQDDNRDRDHARFFTSNNLAFPTAALREIGGFDASYQRAAAEDRELCDRWLELGGRLVLAPDARVFHAHPLDLRTFWRQHDAYGRGAWRFRLTRAARAQRMVAVEPPAFYWGLLTYPVRTHGATGLSLSARLLLAQVANAAGFADEAITTTVFSSSRVPVLPE